jgi:hypothetical protein
MAFHRLNRAVRGSGLIQQASGAISDLGIRQFCLQIANLCSPVHTKLAETREPPDCLNRPGYPFYQGRGAPALLFRSKRRVTDKTAPDDWNNLTFPAKHAGSEPIIEAYERVCVEGNGNHGQPVAESR